MCAAARADVFPNGERRQEEQERNKKEGRGKTRKAWAKSFEFKSFTNVMDLDHFRSGCSDDDDANSMERNLPGCAFHCADDDSDLAVCVY